MDLVDPFFNSEFAIDAVWTHGGVESDIKIIFDKTSVEAPAGYRNSELSATCRTIDIDGVEVNDSLTIDDTVYYIIDIQDEPTGTTKLILSLDQG